jgi:hypothetical protein
VMSVFIHRIAPIYCVKIQIGMDNSDGGSHQTWNIFGLCRKEVYMPRPRGLMTQPKRWAIEDKFGMDIRSVVYNLYKSNENLEDIASALGVTRVTLYAWIGKAELSLIKAQARYSREAETMVVGN